MQAVILIGGLGTRLGSLVKDRPKPLLEVAGRPFVEHLFHTLRRHGIRNVILLAGYRADVVEQHYADAGKSFGLDLSIVVEQSPLGTGGALRGASDALDERFFLLNGDSFFDFNLLDLPLAAAEHPEALVTMAVRQVADTRRYGAVETHLGKVTAFREKSAVSTPGMVNAGVYWIHKASLERIDRTPLSFEREILPSLVAERRVAARAYDGYFVDIGTPEDFVRADHELEQVLRRPALFLDRDDTLIHDRGYTHKAEDLQWIEGVPEALKRANDAGAFVFVVTNQAGVARGYFDEAAVQRFHDHMADALRTIGAHVDDWRYCPHHPEGQDVRYRRSCDCRKPAAGMLLHLLDHWPVDAARSLVLGNSDSDVAAGRNAGLRASRVEVGGAPRAIDAFLAGLSTNLARP